MSRRYFYFSKRAFILLVATGYITTLFLTLITYSILIVEPNPIKRTNKQDKHEKLVSVQMITRHGARTPLHVLPNIEEAFYTITMLESYVKASVSLKTLNGTLIDNEISYIDKNNLNKRLKGGASYGQISFVGEKQMFNLGRRLREKYIENLKFLSDYYDPNQIYIRSSHVMRTIRSAKSVLAGMFTERDDSDAEYIIEVDDNQNEWIYPNPLNCPLYRYLDENFLKLPLLKTSDYSSQLNELNNLLGINKSSQLVTYTALHDDLMARKAHHKPIPRDLFKLINYSDKFAGLELAAPFEHNIKVSFGLFMNEILNNIKKVISKDSKMDKKQKFIYYSGHDSTIGALIVALNRRNITNVEYHWPPFAADIQIELWKAKNINKENIINDKKYDYYIRICYLGKPLMLSNCNDEYSDKTKCNVNKFIKLLQPIAVVNNDEYIRLCNQKIQDL